MGFEKLPHKHQKMCNMTQTLCLQNQREIIWRMREFVTIKWKGEPSGLPSLMSRETKPGVGSSNLSGNASVNIAPVSSLLAPQRGSRAVCRTDTVCLAARVNTLPFCCIPWLHYAARRHTGGVVTSYQSYYPPNPYTGALTCWMRVILIHSGWWGLGAGEPLKYFKQTFESLWIIHFQSFLHCNSNRKVYSSVSSQPNHSSTGPSKFAY